MEVHHHSVHGEVKKKFKEYLQEGLMIFLAVFMGFVAENIREHISDHKKEGEYAIGLVKDLQQDSAKLSDIINSNVYLGKGRDSLVTLLSGTTSAPGFDDNAYRLFFKYATSMLVFNATDRTMSQLVSTGNLRLIEHQDVADSLSGYYNKVKDISVQETVDNAAADDCIRYAQNVFKFQYGLKPNLPNKRLITYNTGTITMYINKLTEMQISDQYYVNADLKELNKNCLKLINLLKQAYDLR